MTAHGLIAYHCGLRVSGPVPNATCPMGTGDACEQMTRNVTFYGETPVALKEWDGERRLRRELLGVDAERYLREEAEGRA